MRSPPSSRVPDPAANQGDTHARRAAPANAPLIQETDAPQSDPGGAQASSFAEFYRRDVEAQLRSGAVHSTLGPRLRSGTFSEAGLDVLARLQGFGLTEGMVCIDYGCGTLRVGQHLIRLLGPGAYWGLDISAYLLAEGRRLIGAGLGRDQFSKRYPARKSKRLARSATPSMRAGVQGASTRVRRGLGWTKSAQASR